MTGHKCPECRGRSEEVADLGPASLRRCLLCGVDFMVGTEEYDEAMAAEYEESL